MAHNHSAHTVVSLTCTTRYFPLLDTLYYRALLNFSPECISAKQVSERQATHHLQLSGYHVKHWLIPRCPSTHLINRSIKMRSILNAQATFPTTKLCTRMQAI
jgi:hypothetical protein